MTKSTRIECGAMITVVFLGAVDVEVSLAEERSVVLGLDFDHKGRIVRFGHFRLALVSFVIMRKSTIFEFYSTFLCSVFISNQSQVNSPK